MLTKRQKQVLDFVTSFIKDRGYSPSLEEIRRNFRLKSVATVHEHIETLRSKDYLKKEPNQPRSIDVLEREQMVNIPLLGTIAAGEPIEAIKKRESIAVPKSKLPRAGEFFALRVISDSMINENIQDGDVILVKQQEVAENKQKTDRFITDDEYEKRLRRLNRKQKRRQLRVMNKLLTIKKCPACNQKEDLDGRCRCVNRDAW